MDSRVDVENRNNGIWIFAWLFTLIVVLIAMGYSVYTVDPYFHYHSPNYAKYYYELNGQRNINDGISRNFDYNAIITGNSMTENFKTTEFDKLFGVKSIKVPYSGGSYKEISDNLRRAFVSNPDIKIVIFCLDRGFCRDKDLMRTDLGHYPDYLYNNNLFDDVEYVFNRDVLFDRVYRMYKKCKEPGFEPGIDSFDDYSNWMKDVTFGINSVCPDGIKSKKNGIEDSHITDEQKSIIKGNITQNITSLAAEYRDIDFYCYVAPYSMAFWNDMYASGRIYSEIESEEYAIGLLLQQQNIHVFSFNEKTEIIGDLNNYKDTIHYGEWINSLILRWIKERDGLLTQENYKQYIEWEKEYYNSFDYSILEKQVDYEDDYYIEGLLYNNVYRFLE